MNISVCNGGGGFTNEITNSGHHGNTDVHNFSLTKTFDSIEFHILGEAYWIKEAEGGDCSGKAVAWSRFIGYPVVEGGDKFLSLFGDGGDGFDGGSSCLGGFGSGCFLNSLGHTKSSSARSDGGGRSKGGGAGNGNGEDGELHDDY